MLQLCLPFASTPLILVTHLPLQPQKGENHHEWRRRPREEWERFPTLLATSKRLSKHPKVFLYRAKWGMVQTLARNKIKNPFFHMSTTPPLSLVLAALNAKFYELNGAQHTFRHSALWFSTQFSTAQPWVVWQHYVFEALGVILVAPNVSICFKINLFLSNHAPLSSCLFSSTTNASY